jgi:Mrp family chromosome partitioning ATPase
MTALDQAFIRAFSQQNAIPVVPPRQPAGDCPDSRVSENGTARTSAAPVGTAPDCAATVPMSTKVARGLAAAPKVETWPAAVPTVREAAPRPISDVFRDVLATLEKPSPRPANPNPERAETPAANDPCKSNDESNTGTWVADWCQSSVSMAGPLDAAEPVGLNESVALMESVCEAEPVETEADPTDMMEPACTAVESPRSVGLLDTPRRPVLFDHQPSAIDPPQSPSPVATLSSFPQVPLVKQLPAQPEFKPAWQVDRFTWPRVCRRLMARAAEEFDRLADAFLAAGARGQKVLAIGGCCRGEGATTLLLCAARRLAERGAKLVLVDADLSRPRLAKRLGVQPQSGWNEVSADDETFFANAVVESAANNLALSGIREPASPSHRTCSDWSRLAPCIENLKSHYEMVLVDLGPLEEVEAIGDVLGQTVAGKIDAVLLVRNPRVTSEARLAAVEQQLTAAGAALAGVIENFVAS